ncbi:hypothetical protein B0O80DRAFT_501973 [Mortierella sp. GBAus27b]|nr:hypothetical protein BGX31_001687 [Mortierella sp. GBA43]KAI8348615.1 hypothetical protein B0O80DRAFT_501973 [Mortierella sp. GBAus27b]
MTRLGLILATSLAAIAATVTGAPISTADDPCTILGRNKTAATYDVVSACYLNVPFNETLAKSTLQTFSTVFNDFFVFRDAALLADLPAPFTSPPVDIIKELDRIGSTNYNNDYSFHTDIARTIASLNDAHAAYLTRCYNIFRFAQPLNLYAPVVDGKQSVRVYFDHNNRTYQDCEVTKIDGEPALAHLKTFADTLGGFSKDSGARLNDILATQMYDRSTGDFTLTSGTFAERSKLPDKGYVDYEIVCPSSTTPVKVSDPWKVLTSSRIIFDDTPSFIKNLCTSNRTSTSQAYTDSASQLVNDDESMWGASGGMTITPKKSALLEFLKANGGPQEPVISPMAELSDAVVVARGNASVFYTLKSKPDVGVVVVFTHHALPPEFNTFLKAFEVFRKSNVTKILIDLQGNGGGYVTFASELVQLFFPDAPPFDTSFPSDLRVTDSIVNLSKGFFNKTVYGIYDASRYIDWTTKTQYKSNELFEKRRLINRGGRDANYTKLATAIPSKLPNFAQLANYTWTNKPGQITILTDGRCGSSCALSTQFFHGHHKVKVYAIGGYQSQALSMFSFVGGTVSNLYRILDFYNWAKVPSPVKPLIYANALSFPILEVYASDSSIPLEYDAVKYPADVHIDFDTTNARRRDTLWNQVAGLAWA